MRAKLRQLLGRGRLFYALRSAAMAIRRRRFGLKHVHPTFYMPGDVSVSPDLVALEFSFLNCGCQIGPGVELGRYVMLGPDVKILGADHVFDRPGVPIIFSGRPETPKTVIEADAWVGAGAFVRQGVRIGRGAIVAAHAVVTRDVLPYEIVAGIPARKVGERFPEGDAREIHDRMLRGPIVRGDFPGYRETVTPLPGDSGA